MTKTETTARYEVIDNYVHDTMNEMIIVAECGTKYTAFEIAHALNCHDALALTCRQAETEFATLIPYLSGVYKDSATAMRDAIRAALALVEGR